MPNKKSLQRLIWMFSAVETGVCFDTNILEIYLVDICGEWGNKLWKNELTGGFWECEGTAERERELGKQTLVKKASEVEDTEQTGS